MSVRAGIVVTGTEVLSGRVQDRNGPWLSDRLLELGIDLAHITICGDRPEDMEAQLRFMASQGVDLVITSGGLGPTADDLTVQVVARFAGRPLELDPRLEERITEILRPMVARWRGIDPEAVRVGTRKQATVPAGAAVLDPIGTAPGCVVPPANGSGPTVVVLPGPPRELQGMWPDAVATREFHEATSGRAHYHQHMLRLFGIPESEIAETLRVAERDIGHEEFSRMEITTCLRRAEVELVVRHEPDAADAWNALLSVVSARHGQTLFSTDGSSIDDQVAELLAGRWVGLAESCTGGLLAGRLTERAGASEYVAGGVVSYSNQAKSDLLGVDPALIERFGAVSPEVASAMADGALSRFGADTAVAITGVAGPGGGTEQKPVGYVCFSVKTSDGRVLARDPRLPGNRAEIRDRSTSVAMHLLRRLLRARKPRSERRPSGRPGSPRARLFLALDLPPEARAALFEWCSGAFAGRSDLRPVAAEALHVTLVFLGYRPEKEIEAIADAAFSPLAGLPAPLLSPRAVVPLPKRRPRLFALDLEDVEGRCVELQAACSGALEAARFYRPEKREFWPHVTLARVKRDARAEPVSGSPAIERFAASEVVLYRSLLSPRGARYEALARHVL